MPDCAFRKVGAGETAREESFLRKKMARETLAPFLCLAECSPQSFFLVASRLVRKRGILPNVGRTFSLLDHEVGDIFSRNRSNSG